MRDGIDYREYIESIKKKVEAWNTVTDCFAFASDEFSAKVRNYFDALDEIYDAAWPNELDDEPVSEEECVENIRKSIDWITRAYIDRPVYNSSAESFQQRQKVIVKNLKRALRVKFNVEVEG